MKSLLLLPIILCGCSYSKPVPGAPYLRAVHIGGWIRPGINLVVLEPGSNAPVVVTQASGQPVLGNMLGTATGAAAGFMAGYGIGRNNDDGGNNTTIIQGEPPAGPIVPPAPPAVPSRPPFGPPPWHGSNPHNKGH